jgi:hypothetical protein
MQTGLSNSTPPRTSENAGTECTQHTVSTLPYLPIPIGPHNCGRFPQTNCDWSNSCPERMPGRVSWAPQNKACTDSIDDPKRVCITQYICMDQGCCTEHLTYKPLRLTQSRCHAAAATEAKKQTHTHVNTLPASHMHPSDRVSRCMHEPSAASCCCMLSPLLQVAAACQVGRGKHCPSQ